MAAMRIRTTNTRDRPRIEETAFGYAESPVGIVEIAGTASAILSLKFVTTPRPGTETNPLMRRGEKSVERYFNGALRRFDLPILLQGTGFQLSVWQQLLKVPFGQTASYRDIAVRINNPQAARAVGLANGKNPISLIVPCHRIIGSDGSLTGYGGGVWRKQWLLTHEQRR